VKNLAVQEGGRVARKPQRVLRPPHLVARFGNRLAHFAGQKLRQLFRVGGNARRQRVEQRAAFVWLRMTKRGLRLSSPRNRSRDLARVGRRDLADHALVVGVQDFDRCEGVLTADGCGLHGILIVECWRWDRPRRG
jgi:hypothetical protein